ncbi:MAG: DUF4388 domain-containing protein [Acidimicrobiales bacterium]|nr:DUF4388 domain-containing protein [Acidimicrobiales bacterium]
MALQGDLKSFALPDVLRLLAGTGKSGVLEVAGPGVSGELALCEGAIVRGGVSSAPHAEQASDVLFELLRLDDGGFAFAEGDQPGEDVATDVESALAAAEALVAEWADVETVVPSMDAWISLVADAGEDGVHLSADQWRAVAAIGGGGNARDLADALGTTDLAACRVVKDLAELELVDIRLSHAAVAPAGDDATFEPLGHHEVPDGVGGYGDGDAYDGVDAYDAFDALDGPAMTELEDLVVEDRPVVLEESEDALLPEPLPGEGVAYDGSDLTGVVDGRHASPADASLPAPPDDAAGAFAAFDDLTGALEPEAGYDHEAAMQEGIGGADPFSPAEVPDASAGETSAEPDPEAASDDERGSLLKFLSTVKP